MNKIIVKLRGPPFEFQLVRNKNTWLYISLKIPSNLGSYLSIMLFLRPPSVKCAIIFM
jgi:hypothetical protein